MKLRCMIAIALMLDVQLALNAQNKGLALRPEVQKTVNSFVGHWTLTGTDSEPNSKAVQLQVVMDCEPAALGTAVSCQLSSSTPDGDHSELVSLIGYSADEGIVRLMEVSSSGANHVHTGPWNGDVIEFKTLAYSEGGQKRVETFAIGFPSPGKITVKSVTQIAEGKSILNLVGTRR